MATYVNKVVFNTGSAYHGQPEGGVVPNDLDSGHLWMRFTNGRKRAVSKVVFNTGSAYQASHREGPIEPPFSSGGL